MFELIVDRLASWRFCSRRWSYNLCSKICFEHIRFGISQRLRNCIRLYCTPHTIQTNSSYKLVSHCVHLKCECINGWQIMVLPADIVALLQKFDEEPEGWPSSRWASLARGAVYHGCFKCQGWDWDCQSMGRIWGLRKGSCARSDEQDGIAYRWDRWVYAISYR